MARHTTTRHTDSGAEPPDQAHLSFDNWCFWQRPGRPGACPNLSSGNPSLQLRLFPEREAARILGISPDTLRRERKRGRIGYVMIGRRPRYAHWQLAEYVSLREVKPCDENSDQLAPDKSPTTGSAGGRIAPCGAERGSTPSLDRRAEHLSALTILQKPGSRSRGGSQ
jgi:hypothetical protein